MPGTTWLAVAALLAVTVTSPVSTSAQEAGWWASVSGKVGHVTGNLDSRFTLDGGNGADGAGSSTGADSENEATAATAEPAGDSGATASSDAAGPLDPAAVDPANPDTASLILTWLGTAEPPENATQGARFRFSTRAARIGTAANGGIVTAPHDPAIADPVWLWANRRATDSVDHCTMEEYVVSRLANNSIAHCRGRYQRVAAASDGGGEPGDGAGPTSSGLRVPDLTGMTSRQAREQLESMGLSAVVRPGAPGQSASDTGKVAGLDPATDVTVQPGTRIVVTVYAPFVPTRKVPDLQGLTSRQAKEQLANAGLTATIRPGPAAPGAADIGRVAAQQPPAGAALKPGSPVTVTVFTPSVAARTVPDLVGLTFDVARSRLLDADLTAVRQNVGTAANRRESGKVVNQQPQPGTQVQPRSSVTVGVLGDYVPSRAEQIAAFDCSGWPNAEAFWDQSQNAPGCRCISGTTWQQESSTCAPVVAAAPEPEPEPQPEPEPAATPASEQSYFVGTWALNPAACTGQAQPPAGSTSSSSDSSGLDVAGAVGDAIGEALEEAFAKAGFVFAADGTLSLVNFENGEVVLAGSWAYANGIIESIDSDGDVNRARVLERRADRFVVAEAEDSDTDRTAFWRCSTAAER